MGQLPANMTVPLGDDELPSSLCSRIAYLNRRSGRDFCLDMGFTFQGVVDGDQATLNKLAERSRVDPDALARSAIVRQGDRTYTFKGHAMRRSSLLRGRIRACAGCLRDDLGSLSCTEVARPYQRAIWVLASVRTCPVHEAALIELGHDLGPHTIHDFTRSVEPRIREIEALALSASARSLSELEGYLLDRLDGGGDGAPWLQGLRYDAAAKACEILGAVAVHGPQVKISALSEDELYDAGARGFEIARHGEPAICELLNLLQSKCNHRRLLTGPKTAFGRLYDWLAHESDDDAYEPLRDIIMRHAIETMPLGPGDEIFGRPVSSRKMHSVRTASIEFETHPKRLRKLLLLGGLIEDTTPRLHDDKVLFGAEESRAFIHRVLDALPMTEAAKYLNVPRPHDRGLLEHGFIRPVIELDQGVLTHYNFAKADLDDFLERLLAGADEPGEADAGFCNLLSAGKQACCAVMEIVRLKLEGKLTRTRKSPTYDGFLSLLVDPDEVRLLVRREEHGGLSLRETEKSLGVRSDVLTALLAQSHLPFRVGINPVNRCPQKLVMRADLDEFMRTYVSLIRLARERGVHFSGLKSALEEGGVPLAFDRETIATRFYRRDSLPPV
ncbi:hypothetical protein FJ979_20590 [Mesorhizobium sp. B1-1-6]|nr:hypothetical protein FJ979_20590 [Mesorhizobium sp. B1-1-6]